MNRAPTSPISPLSHGVALALAVAGGSALGWLASILIFGVPSAGALGAAGLAGAAWLVGSALGLAVLLLVARGRHEYLGTAVLGSSGTRTLTALFLGVILYFSLAPDGRAFWAVFLLAGLDALIVETVWAMRVNRSLDRHAAPTIAPPAGGAA